MAETIMREPSAAPVRSSLTELELSLDSMRIYCEVMNDLLSLHDSTSQDSSIRLNERLTVMVRSLISEVQGAEEARSAAWLAACEVSAGIKGGAQ